jgi:hypothetical protein
MVVSQLNGEYHVLDPTLLQRFLEVHLLEHSFDFITYVHVSRSHNLITNTFVNYVLDWHLYHL